jgi:hypothetical protein
MLSPVEPCAAGRQPPRTYYQLLGVAPDERDPRVIEEAALRCAAEARVYQLTREVECAQALNEIARAADTLLDPARRREYDRGLPRAAAPAPAEGGLELLLDEGGACDVKLVYRDCPPRPADRRAG